MQPITSAEEPNWFSTGVDRVADFIPIHEIRLILEAIEAAKAEGYDDHDVHTAPAVSALARPIFDEAYNMKARDDLQRKLTHDESGDEEKFICSAITERNSTDPAGESQWCINDAEVKAISEKIAAAERTGVTDWRHDESCAALLEECAEEAKERRAAGRERHIKEISNAAVAH